MNALVHKEFRLILPAWGVAVAALIAAQLTSGHLLAPWEGIIFTFCLGMLGLGLSPFGREFSSGSFSSLLAQPFPRERLWRAKIRHWLSAALTLFCLFLFLWTREPLFNGKPDWTAFCIVACTSLAVLTGGLWTTLLLRQITAAFWITLLVPGALALGVSLVTEWLVLRLANVLPAATPDLERLIPIAISTVFVLYSIIGYWWARRLFLQAQDVGWTAGEVHLPQLGRGFNTRLRAGSDPSRRPLRALLDKEFQLHGLTLFFAVGVFVLHLAALVVRASGNQSSGWYQAASVIWALWLIVPIVAGAESVAYERQLGTMEGQLCLSARRRTQYAVKLFSVLVAGVIFGGVIPWLMESQVPAGVSSDFISIASDPQKEDTRSALLLLVLSGAGLAVLSFYVSTLTRSTLHALGGALTGCIVVWALMLLGRPEAGFKAPLWRTGLCHLIGGPSLAVVLIALSYWNFKRLHQAGQLCRRNLAMLIVWLVFTVIATPLIYYRTWELVISPEPRHGPARIVGSGKAKLCVASDRLFILLPDGRIWAATNRDHAGIPRTGTFLGGSNWVDLAGGPFGVAAIRADGSLWSLYQQRRTVVRTSSSSPSNSVSEVRPLAKLAVAPKPGAATEAPPEKHGEPIRGEASPPGATATNLSTEEPSQWMAVESIPAFRRRHGVELEPWSPPPQMIAVHWRTISSPERIGTDSNWKSLAAGRGHFLVLKRDGSLWGWGDNTERQLGEGSEWFANGPVRIGKDSDWLAVFASQTVSAGVKRDGSLWKWGYLYRLPEEKPLRQATSFASPVRWNLPGTNLIAWECEPYYDLALYADGSAQAVGYVPQGLLRTAEDGGGNDRQADWRKLPTQLVATGGWREILAGDILVGLRRDGTLWKQVVGQLGIRGAWRSLSRFSDHADWIGVSSRPTGHDRMITGLASDGTLCCWAAAPFAPSDAPLAPSRRPLWSLNIFDTAK